MNAASGRSKGGRGSRTLAGTVLVIIALLALAVIAFVRFFPADQLRAQFERRVSAATGYTVTVGRLDLGWSGFGVALVARDLVAVSADGSQRFEAPLARMRVALAPLLKRSIVLTAASADHALLAMGPPTTAAAGAPAGASSAANSAAVPGLIAPKIEITNSRIAQNGTDGVTTLFGVAMKGSYRQGAARPGAPAGVFKGAFTADSLSFAPHATPDKPLVLPGLDLDFNSTVSFQPQTISTTLAGRWGGWPGKGTVESAFDADLKGWRNRGQFAMEKADLEKLAGFLGRPGAALHDYALHGRLEAGQVTFETRPDRQPMDYDFRAKFRNVKASLPGKGEVIRDGDGELHVVPDNLNMTGAFALGRARLDLDAHVTHFAAPEWQAQVKLAGPAGEALRFLPPEKTFGASGGSLDLDLKVAGQVGQPGLPQATGTVRVEKLALKIPGLAAPVDRLDVTATLLWNSARLEQGFVSAGGSSAHFTGVVADLRKPELALDVAAETLNLDELFPKNGGAAAAAPPQPGPGAAVIPISGRITAKKLVRERLTISDASAGFSAGAAGIELKDLIGGAYGGTVNGAMTLKPAGGNTWAYSGNFRVDDARVGEILGALTPIHDIEGKIRARFNLSGRTGPGVDVKKDLTLDARGVVLDGALINIPAIGKISRLLKFKEGAPERFAFRTLRHRVRVENGFALLDTLHLDQGNADWDLAGRIGLDGSLDCPVVAHLDPSIFQEGTDYRTAAQVLAGPDGRLALAFHLGGSLSNPDVSINLDPLTEAATKKASDALTDELKKRLGGLLKKP